VADAFERRFGAEDVVELAARISASEDFSLFAAAWGVPAVFWAVGGVDPDTFKKAEEAGKLDELPVNHSPDFAPITKPTLRVGIEAMLTAGGVWLMDEGSKT
jgi:metal-dependent amidase/aminoacylase/carboxypeptidase family protein